MVSTGIICVRNSCSCPGCLLWLICPGWRRGQECTQTWLLHLLPHGTSLNAGLSSSPEGRMSLCPQQGWNLCCAIHSYSIEIREYWTTKEPITDLCGLNTDHEHLPSQPIGGLVPSSPKGHSCLCLAGGLWHKRAVLVSEGKRRLQHVLASVLKQII